jgi:hypothetical protein
MAEGVSGMIELGLRRCAMFAKEPLSKSLRCLSCSQQHGQGKPKPWARMGFTMIRVDCEYIVDGYGRKVGHINLYYREKTDAIGNQCALTI